MKFYILFKEKHEGRNIVTVVNSSTKTQALTKVSQYRNDGIVYGPNDRSFTLEDVVENWNKYLKVSIDDLKDNYSNTKKIYKLTKTDNSITYFEGREDELEVYLKRFNKGGLFFTIGRDRFFVITEKKKKIPLFSIQVVKEIPLQIEDTKPTIDF